MSEATTETIRHLLRAKDFPFREVRHPPTTTSKESAEARGEPLEIGGKALLLKLDSSFGLFVMSASMRLDSRRVCKELDVKKVRFATPPELFEITGLQPGSVPPFGEPLFNLPLYLDYSIFENDRIAFNAGSLEVSIIMSVTDYLELAKPTRKFSFARSELGEA